jgi:peptidoglycan/LPS O-acetylase OafA/YrhL
MGNPADATLSYDAYLARKYVPELDGLRALSVLIVVSVHMHDQVWGWLNGWLGVTVFFVLSGYLITNLALDEEERSGSLSLGAFYVRRSFRIFPLYYVTLGIYCVLILVLKISPEKHYLLLRALPYYLLYMQEVPFFFGLPNASGEIVHRDIPFYQSWSLGIEEKFYLVWPVLAFVLWRGRHAVRFAGTTGLVLLFALIPTLLALLAVPMADPIGACLYPYSHILLGCLVALLLRDRKWYEFLRVLGRWPWNLVVPAVFVIYHFAWTAFGASTGLSSNYLHSLYALLAGLLVVAVLLGDGPVHRVLRTRPLVLVGKLSYGVYLIHILALNVAQRLVPSGQPPRTEFSGVSLAAYLLACLISVAAAYGLYLIVEKPCIAIGRRWSRHILERNQRRHLATASPAAEG